ncbi:MAG: serine/threonine protein kinase, partial [Bacteroides sp.]
MDIIGKEILNYVILSLIGKGGMGSVYLAEHKYIKQQKVAIKVINANMVNDFTRNRLAEEADRLSRLNHPNIVRFVNYHIDEAGNVYLIMEYADGDSLEHYIKHVSGLIVEEKLAPLFEPLLDAF